jgi:RHS repeat-associated protein
MIQTVDFTIGNTGCYHYHYDGNGNVVEITNASATVVASYRYDAFGRTLVKAGTYADTNRYRFSTKPVEVTSGIYYYGYRYYDPLHGRWTTRDPIAEDGGFNIYTMTENSLISGYDILGMANAPKMCCPQGQNLVKARGTGEWCCSGSLTIKQAKDGSWYESCGGGEAEKGEKKRSKTISRAGGGSGFAGISNWIDGNCHDASMAAMCSADAILNGAVGEVPFVGTFLGVTGIELNPMQSLLGRSTAPGFIVGPDSIGLGTGSQMAKSAGEHYQEMGEGYVGPHMRKSLRMQRTNARILGKLLPGISNILGIIDTYGNVSECISKNCK